MMHYLLILLIGYLLGCSNMAVYLAAAQNVDLRSGGSGNPGASNALILMGVDDNMTNIIKGLIIVGAVILDMRKNAKKV